MHWEYRAMISASFFIKSGGKTKERNKENLCFFRCLYPGISV